MSETIPDSKNNTLLSIFFYFLFFLISAKIIIGILYIFQAVFLSSSIGFSDTGYSYQFKLFIGYVEINHENFPPDTVISNRYFLLLSVVFSNILFNLIPLFFIMIYGQKILKILTSSYSPFVSAMPGYIRKIGWLFIATGFLGKCLQQILINLINFNCFHIKEPVQVYYLICGYLLLVLSNIFSKGVQLQISDDETL